MKTTETILAALAERRDAALAEHDHPEVHRIDQAVIAHQQLARLRTQHADYVDRGEDAAAAQFAAQIGYWRRQVDEDVDEPTTEPAEVPDGGAEVGAALPPGRVRNRRPPA